MSELYPIRVAAERTGLTPHRIRAWERRYRAIVPRRSNTNRRLYSDADLERIVLLHRATLNHRSIAEIAQFSITELREIVAEDERGAASRTTRVSQLVRVHYDATTVLESCIEAVRELDTSRLHRLLDNATVLMGRAAVLDRIVVPMMHTLGSGWRHGELRPVHEHVATAVVRTFLGNLNNLNSAFQFSPTAPQMVVATPAGQLHELGALIAAGIAVSEGWRATYLGPNLVAEAIAEPARRLAVRAVALSILYPLDDPGLPSQLMELANLLPPVTALLVGGPSASSYRGVLERVGAIQLADYDGLRTTLGTLRSDDTSEEMPRGERAGDGEHCTRGSR